MQVVIRKWTIKAVTETVKHLLAVGKGDEVFVQYHDGDLIAELRYASDCGQLSRTIFAESFPRNGRGTHRASARYVVDAAQASKNGAPLPDYDMYFY